MGAAAFADRAALELLATAGRARKRTVETREDLTSQEAQIARLAREGLSKPEIGARLFISPCTVEYHLHKLGISSRSQLDRALPAQPTVAVSSELDRQLSGAVSDHAEPRSRFHDQDGDRGLGASPGLRLRSLGERHWVRGRDRRLEARRKRREEPGSADNHVEDERGGAV
jgi:DNA-binding CsgD family transcriptional regulator